VLRAVKKISCISLIILLLGCTGLRLALIPSEIKRYCRKISGAAEGINRSMETCITYELEAKKKLSNTAVPADIEEYCRHLSGSTGGSYQVILTCVHKEMQAL
jgi:hypothetical protein